MTADNYKQEVFILKDKLFRFSKRILNDNTEAQDVTQDVLMKLWDMRGELHKYNSIEAFAMTTTRNLSLDRARRKNLRYSKEPEIKYETVTIEQKNELENKELGELIRSAIQNLKEPQRTIMYLRDMEQYSFEEIEPIVEMTTETLRVNLSRARKKVREELKKYWNMEQQKYKALLDKYFEGLSSLDEELDLRNFLQEYHGEDADFLEAKAMFQILSEEKNQTVNIDFNSIVGKGAMVKRRKIYGFMSGVAATLVIGLSLMFLLKNNSAPIVYAYVNGKAITDKELAIQQSKQALSTLSTNLNKGTQGLNYMIKMNKPKELLIVKKQ